MSLIIGLHLFCVHFKLPMAIHMANLIQVAEFNTDIK